MKAGRVHSHWVWAVVATAPWLVGARGCIEELSVGVDRYGESPDAGNAGDGGVVDGGVSVCKESSCTGERPEPVVCSDGESRTPECVLVDASCQWQPPVCLSTADGGGDPQPCREDECDFILAFDLVSVSEEFGCTDGKPPVCQRNSSGFCSYECAPDVSCSLENNTCGADSFCVFRLGTCGQNGDTALCQPKSNVCPEIYEPVCGCDGVTYENTCKAFRFGISVAFNGECDTKPELCNECASKTFAFTGELCADGLNHSGPTCVSKPKGGCDYQWLACPSDACTQVQREAPGAGECWTNKDCQPGQECLEVSVCGCNQTCLSADRPGHCA